MLERLSGPASLNHEFLGSALCYSFQGSNGQSGVLNTVRLLSFAPRVAEQLGLWLMAISLHYQSFLVKLLAISVRVLALMVYLKTLTDANLERAVDVCTPFSMFRKWNREGSENMQHFGYTTNAKSAASTAGFFFKKSYLILIRKTCKLTAIY